MTDVAELPFERSWWIDAGRVIGGRYPGTDNPARSGEMLARLLDIGVGLVVNLQQPAELGHGGRPFPDYAPALHRLAAERAAAVQVERFPIPDWGVTTAQHMSLILGSIDATVAQGRRVYVHCWGGHGRTGTVAGCWLVRNGLTPAAALNAIRQARRHDPHLARERSPQSDDQRAMVRGWR